MKTNFLYIQTLNLICSGEVCYEVCEVVFVKFQAIKESILGKDGKDVALYKYGYIKIHSPLKLITFPQLNSP